MWWALAILWVVATTAVCLVVTCRIGRAPRLGDAAAIAALWLTIASMFAVSFYIVWCVIHLPVSG